MKIRISGILLILFLFSSAASAEIKVIKSDFYRDGGTLCVKYEKDIQVIEICIDHRERVGTGKVYVGGYPDNQNARIASKK